MAASSRIRVGIVGASGYSGMVLTRLLGAHPQADLRFCTSDKWSGQEVRPLVGGTAPASLRFVPNGAAVTEAADVDVVFLATSAEVSLELAPKLLTAQRSVIDLSGAFRLRDASSYPKWYKLEHREPELLARAQYGLPEAFGAVKPGLVANPGCYPTACILLFAPLLRAGLIESSGLIFDAKSGVTGAGRQAKEDYSFCEIDGDFRAYKLFSHQHTPEIAQAMGVPSLTFTAHLLPVRRGILTTGYARTKPGVGREQLEAALQDAYRDAPFVRVLPPEQVTLNRVVGTNLCALGVTYQDGLLIGVSGIDNLIKGAAGQAVQNFNAMMGLPQTVGLDGLSPSSP